MAGIPFDVPVLPTLKMGSTIIWILLGSVVAAGVGFIFVIMKRYNTPVLVLEVVGDGVLLRKKKGGLIRDKDKAYKFKLFGVKQSIHPPPSDAYVFTKNGKKALLCSQISPTDYVWIRPKIGKNEADLIPIEQDVLFWYINAIENDQAKYQDAVKWWQNPYIIGLAALAFSMVIVIVTFKYAQTWADSGASVYAQAVESARGLVGQVVE